MQQKRTHSISLSFPHSHTPFYLQEFHSLGTEVQIQLTGNGYLLSFQLFTRYFPMKFSSRWHDHRANKSKGRTCALVRHLPSARQRTISFNAWAFGGLYFYFHLIGEKFAADFRASYHQRGNANPSPSDFKCGSLHLILQILQKQNENSSHVRAAIKMSAERAGQWNFPSNLIPEVFFQHFGHNSLSVPRA